MEADKVNSIDGDVSLADLIALEGSYCFECEHCKDVFETVEAWAKHSAEMHRDKPYGLMPIPKT